jgi:CheY-like chemotaxis protein
MVGGLRILLAVEVQMPPTEGYEATPALRQIELPRTAGGPAAHPVIGLTAHALREDRQRCLEAGMDDYLARPAEPHDPYDAIGRNVRRVRGLAN